MQLNPFSRRLPSSATLALLIITVSIYLLQTMSMFIFGYDVFALYGSKINQLILEGQVWRFLTPVFLHGSILHIGFNMYALYSIGPRLEAQFGSGPFIALYLISGLWGNTFSFLLTPNASLGASTAIFGLIAAEGVYIYKNRHLLGSAARPMLMNILVIVLVNLALGLSPGVDNWGHVGGLLGGFFFAWFSGPTYGVVEGLFGKNVVLSRDRRTILVTIAATLIPSIFIFLKFISQ